MRRPIFGLTATEVFTPRKHAVNNQMYVHRPNLEKQLLNAARGAKHFCVFGESGNGKSWLYKHVFSANKIEYINLNLSKALVLGSIVDAIKSKVSDPDSGIVSSKLVTKDASIQPGRIGVKGTVATTKQYSEKDPIKTLFEKIKGTSRFPSIVVFDNFEMVLKKPELIEELSNLIVMLDDDDYGDFNVRFCFVGVPSEIRDYLAHQDRRSTIMTRITEIDEVARMRPEQARMILDNGFERLLRLSFLEPERRELIYDRLIHVSDRIATELHALGLEVALAAQENDGYIEDLLVDDAINSWLSNSHSSVRETITERLNSEGKGRRSQVLFCLGKVDTEDFTASEVQSIFLKEFGYNANGRPVSVGRLLNELTRGPNPPICKTKSGEAFRFTNPKYRMAVRAMLRKQGQIVGLPKNKL